MTSISADEKRLDQIVLLLLPSQLPMLISLFGIYRFLISVIIYGKKKVIFPSDSK